MRISDWSSDVCSSDLATECARGGTVIGLVAVASMTSMSAGVPFVVSGQEISRLPSASTTERPSVRHVRKWIFQASASARSEERRVGQDVSIRLKLGGRRCHKKKKKINTNHTH